MEQDDHHFAKYPSDASWMPRPRLGEESGLYSLLSRLSASFCHLNVPTWGIWVSWPLTLE